MRVRLRWWALLLLLPLLTGCWSNRAVELRSMVMTMGFSPGPGHEIKVTLQIPTRTGLTSLTGNSGSGSKSALDYTVAASGITPGMAMTHLQSLMQTDLYLGQVQVIVVSTHLSPSALKMTEEYLTRLGPLNKSAYVVATPSVGTLLQTEPATGQMPALDLIGGFDCPDCETVNYRQDEWAVEVAIPTAGDTLWMPYVTVAPSGFSTGQIVVYQGYRPVWVLPPQQTMLLGLVLNRTGKGYVSFKAAQWAVGLRTLASSTGVSTHLTGGRLHMQFNLSVTGTLDSWNGPNLSPIRVCWIDTETDDYLASHVIKVLVRLQQEGAMPGAWLAPMIWRSDPAWQHASTWEREYRRAAIRVRVRFRLTDVGESD